MSRVKRTYALSETTLRAFEQKVPAGERSALVASLLQEWLDRERRAKLRDDIAEGCREMAELYLEIEKEYHPLEEEVQRGLDNQPKTRRRRAGEARSRRRLRTGG